MPQLDFYFPRFLISLTFEFSASFGLVLLIINIASVGKGENGLKLKLDSGGKWERKVELGGVDHICLFLGEMIEY